MWERPFAALPKNMQNETVRRLYSALNRKRGQLAVKRAFDITGALVLLCALGPLFGAAACLAAADGGPVFFCQRRVTQYGRPFVIFKFRTMRPGAGPGVTAGGDGRITPAGAFLRKWRLDELPQLWNILTGDMSFVGPRPEVPEFVRYYTPEMLATLLLPAGLTGPATLRFCKEEEMLARVRDPEKMYREKILPLKAAENLRYISGFSLRQDIRALCGTLAAMAGELLAPVSPHPAAAGKGGAGSLTKRTSAGRKQAPGR